MKMTEGYPERERLMLEAAATGMPYRLMNGQEIMIDAAAVKHGQERVAKVEVRLLKLTDSNWKD